MSENLHLSEHDLVLAADGELAARRRAEVTAHLESCWSCRERMLSLENTIADFVRARNRQLNEQLPSAAGPRALLRARLAEAASSSSVQAGRLDQISVRQLWSPWTMTVVSFQRGEDWRMAIILPSSMSVRARLSM